MNPAVATAARAVEDLGELRAVIEIGYAVMERQKEKAGRDAEVLMTGLGRIAEAPGMNAQ